MPTHQFHCGRCGKQFDQNVRIGQKTTKCTGCGNPKTKKKLSFPSGVSFKGPGFACNS